MRKGSKPDGGNPRISRDSVYESPTGLMAMRPDAPNLKGWKIFIADNHDVADVPNIRNYSDPPAVWRE